jgi:hypothetical protein
MSSPRIIGVGREFAASIRHYDSHVSPDFETIYRAANLVYPSQIMRWFDDRIFGLTMPQVNLHNSGINLHEGLLLYSSAFVAFLIILGTLTYPAARVGPERLQGDAAPVFLLFLIFAVFVTLTKTGYWVMYQVLFHIDFMHGRITTAAALAQAALATIFLLNLATRNPNRPPRYPGTPWLIVCAAAGGTIVVVIERVARSASGFIQVPGLRALGPPVTVTESATLRICISVAMFALVASVIFAFRRREKVRAGLACVLGVLMVGQAFVNAGEQIAGPQLQTDRPPFLEPVRLLAKPNEFHWPSASARRSLGEALETDRFRTALVCDRTVIQVPCSTFLSNFWGLRAAEGYVSSIPMRVADLPWHDAMSLRYVTFWSVDSLPWSLLGLLNVKYAISATPSLLTNSVRGAGGAYRELGPQDVTLVANTLPVTPRVFFATSVQPVATINDAMDKLFTNGQADPKGYDVITRSYVEGYPASARFVSGGGIRAEFHNQRAQIAFEPADQSRFLVINERFDRDWHAYAGEIELAIYPTNIFMRGMVVPAGVESIRLHYRPFVQTPLAGALLLLGIALLLLGAIAAKRLDQRSERARA